MAKIYTRKGDYGKTLLANGKTVAKSSNLIEFYGTLDELNAFLGWGLEALYSREEFNELIKKIYRIQQELFGLSAQLTNDEICFSQKNTLLLEEDIDSFSNNLPPLKSFVLPSGGEASVRLHIARAVCRRAERIVFKLEVSKNVQEIAATYLNRLSDWLYVAARYIAFISNVEEICL